MSHPSYKRLVEQMWNDKRITPEKLGALVKLQEQFSISDALASEIECSVMGMTKEEALVAGLGFGAVTPVPPTPTQAPTPSPPAELGQPTVSGAKTTTGQERSNRSATPASNFLVRGRYKVLETLGSGGMGKVFKVLDTRLGEVRALKVLAQDHTNRPDLLERMRREVRLCQRLRHPGIVQVFDYDEDAESGLAFFTMEFVEGRTLRQWLSGRKAEVVPMEEVVRITDRLIDALEYAHGQGVVHLDLKPDNIMVSDDLTQIRILDFGISRAVDAIGLQTMMRGAGTPYYMAPEQEQGALDVGPPADIYALGAILYELLTGRAPRGIFAPPHQLRPEVPQEWSGTVMAAMHTQTSRRPTLQSLRHPSRPPIRSPELPKRTSPAKQESTEINALEILQKEYEVTPNKDRPAWIARLAPINLSKWLAEAEKDHSFAQFLVARCLDLGIGGKKDPESAARWYERSATAGYSLAQSNLGNHHADKNTEESLLAAVHWYTKAADQGLATAQYNLARCLWKGKGTPKDEQATVKWLQKAASQGHVEAQTFLGMCYADGQGIAQDLAAAADCYRAAADRGHAAAQNALGDCMFVGKGLPQNPEGAFHYYSLAAHQGHAKAQFNLAFCLENGKGTRIDRQQAIIWYEKAANQGNRQAAEALNTLRSGNSNQTAETPPARDQYESGVRSEEVKRFVIQMGKKWEGASDITNTGIGLGALTLLAYTSWRWYQSGWGSSGWAILSLLSAVASPLFVMLAIENHCKARIIKKTRIRLETFGVDIGSQQDCDYLQTMPALPSTANAVRDMIEANFAPDQFTSEAVTMILLGALSAAGYYLFTLWV